MEQKGRVIFYSWQSDDKKSKNFIEKWCARLDLN